MTSIAKLYRAQGLSPPSDGELAKLREAKRAKNVANAEEVLERNCIGYTKIRHPEHEIEFEVRYKNGRLIRYWPETGAWIDTKLDKPPTKFGVRNLVIYLKGSVM